MTIMVDNPFVALTFISGPAILTNACAIMQNSATIRYSLAIPQWRELRASLAVHSDLIDGLYADPDAALALAERRIRLPLGGLNLLDERDRNGGTTPGPRRPAPAGSSSRSGCRWIGIRCPARGDSDVHGGELVRSRLASAAAPVAGGCACCSRAERSRRPIRRPSWCAVRCQFGMSCQPG